MCELKIEKGKLIEVVEKFRILDNCWESDDGGQPLADELCNIFDELLVENGFRKYVVCESHLDKDGESNNPTPKELGLIK